MIKNKVLTPVLAGVLGVSVVGSGVGYYFVNKDGATQNGPTEKMDSLKVSMTQTEKNVTLMTPTSRFHLVTVCSAQLWAQAQQAVSALVLSSLTPR